MQIPLSLYDFFGYALPGLVVIVLFTILVITPLETDRQSMVDLGLKAMQRFIDPDTTSEDETGSSKDGLGKSLSTTIIRMILYGLVCYLVGTEARDRIGDFITNVYNQKRPHSALGYLTPVEFSQQNLS